MKLDKRACRHAANVPLHISLNAGVLYTDRVKYLVTAAVKLLGGHRVLAVYFYDCERLKANDRMPKWVVFQGKDDFATLERDAAGNVKWRDAMLTNLTGYYSGSFLPACVFYKKTGCHTISVRSVTAVPYGTLYCLTTSSWPPSSCHEILSG